MTRRIALAILLTVWATLVVAGAATYLTTRTLLLAELDAQISVQALGRPAVVPGQHLKRQFPVSLPDESRFRVTAGPGKAAVGPPTSAEVRPAFEPRIASVNFSRLADGTRMRTVALEALVQPAGPRAPSMIGTVIESGNAEPFHHQMNLLALALAASGVVGGLLAAGLAVRVSRAALRPLHGTAEVIGAIDERRLDGRIAVDGLPAELVPVGQRLNELLERLEEAFAQRNRFLADASHELRTPVAALVTGIEVTLARPRDAAAYRAALKEMLGESTHLRRLVERLMEHVRSQRFTHEEPARDVDASDLLEECADVAAALATAKGVELRRQISPGLRLQTQPGRLRSIVQNVLANAVEYNRAGGWVELRVAADGGRGLAVEVQDTGPGIAPDQLPHLFEPFYRGDASRRVDAVGHLGLGLALVKAHADALGGQCTVRSKLGNGSTFRIELPPLDVSGPARDKPMQQTPAGKQTAAHLPVHPVPRLVTRALLGLLTTAVLVSGPATVVAAGKQPKKTDGAYAATVRGFYTGTGTAEVRGPGKKVQIKADVETEDGRSGQLNAPNLTLDGDHFSGSGKVMGVDVALTGRLDGYADDEHFKRARILCTYKDANGRVGRIVGVIE